MGVRSGRPFAERPWSGRLQPNVSAIQLSARVAKHLTDL